MKNSHTGPIPVSSEHPPGRCEHCLGLFFPTCQFSGAHSYCPHCGEWTAAVREKGRRPGLVPPIEGGPAAPSYKPNVLGTNVVNCGEAVPTFNTTCRYCRKKFDVQQVFCGSLLSTCPHCGKLT